MSAKTTRILYVEDDRIDQEIFTRHVHEEKLAYACHLASSVEEAGKILATEVFDVIVTDLQLGDATAFDLLALKLDTPIIIITGAGDEETAVRAMKAGAHDYFVKDSNRIYLKRLPISVERAVELQRSEKQVKLFSEKEVEDSLVICGEGLGQVRRMIDLAAGTSSPVFITGETGTGKNLVAKAIHYRSPLRSAPFVGINCAGFPEGLIEGELFGYERGAFTGALAAKKGIFELAEGGTLLLDEIGEMPVHLQTKLLGVLEDKFVRRLGSESSRPIDVRVTAATNVDAKALGKTFRNDLYYRLSVITIALPALRHRVADIPELCHHLLRKLNNGADIDIADSEITELQRYPWPGNVRELKNVLERSLILHRGCELRPSLLLRAKPLTPPAFGDGDDRGATIEEIKEAHIRETFRRHENNITRTAKALDITITTLKKLLRRYGVLDDQRAAAAAAYSGEQDAPSAPGQNKQPVSY